MTAHDDKVTQGSALPRLALAAAFPMLGCSAQSAQPAATKSADWSMPISAEPEAVPESFTTSYASIAQGGGFSTTMDIAGDGSFMTADTDVHNGYIRRRGADRWQKLLRQNNLPRDLFDPEPPEAKYNGCTWSTTIGPDSRTILTAWQGRLLRSDDAGASFVPTVLEPKKFYGALGAARLFGHAIAAHERGWLVGTSNDGCYFSRDGFRGHQLALDLPPLADDFRGEPTKHLTAWTPYGDALVFIWGTGLFHAPGGPETQFLFLGGPKYASHLVTCPTSGAIYVCEYRNTKTESVTDAVWRYRDRAWQRLANSRTTFTLAVDPFDPDHLLMANENGGWAHTHDGGKSISWFSTVERGEGESEWLSNIRKRNYPSDVRFDPVERNQVFMTEGVGIDQFKAPPRGANTLVLRDINNGNYELLATCGLSVTGRSTILLGVMDKGVQIIVDGAFENWSYCPHYGKEPNRSGVAHARALDYAADDPNFVVGLFHQDGGNGCSSDGGRSWTPLAPPPGRPRWLPGGDVAVATSSNFMIVEGNAGGVWATQDGGRSFAPCDFAGDGVQEAKQISSSYVQRDCATADKTRPGTFAMLYNNAFTRGKDAAGKWIKEPKSGIWINRSGGTGAWEQTVSGLVDEDPGRAHSAQFWQAKLAFIDGRPGELLYAALGAQTKGADNLVWLQDDGRKLTDLPVKNLKCFDFGKPAPGSAYPSLWLWGEVAGRLGWYVTFDWFATDPLFIGRWPVNTISKASDGMVADRNHYRCHMGLAGNGWVTAHA